MEREVLKVKVFVLYASVGIFVLLFSNEITEVSSCNCTFVLCLGARAPNQAESTHLITASVQVNAFHFPCRIIFKSKGNINCIIIPGLDFGKK